MRGTVIVKKLIPFHSCISRVKTVCRLNNFTTMNRFATFNFMNYNGIGFDLDHTICQYNLENILKLQYKLLVDYLIEKGFPSHAFSKELTFDDVDFIQRGLFLDFKKGNILQLSEDGLIVRACHGTKSLSTDEIRLIYGPNMKWEPTTMFVENKLSVWDKPWSGVMRSMMDFTDAQVPLVFAQVIDFIDQSHPGTTSYSVWPLILDGIIDMFKPGGSYYVNLYSTPHVYIKKCKKEVLDWMSKLRSHGRCLFLLTGAREQEAEFLSAHSLGKDWKQLFDLIVYDAKKPGFFTENRPFLEKEELQKNIVFPLQLTQGNWKVLHSLICQKTSESSSKCVYIGDNLLQDVYATSLTSNIDSIAIVEELSEEELSLKEKFESHPNPGFVKSKKWFSYIFADRSSFTVWGSIMRHNSKLSIPSLEYVAKKPVDHIFVPLWEDKAKL